MPRLEGLEAASHRNQCHGKIQGAGIRMRSRDWPAGGVRGLAGSEAVVREWDRVESSWKSLVMTGPGSGQPQCSGGEGQAGRYGKGVQIYSPLCRP